jgi:DNA invertase Pin-like site-specific DNA recombinase
MMEPNRMHVLDSVRRFEQTRFEGEPYRRDEPASERANAEAVLEAPRRRNAKISADTVAAIRKDCYTGMTAEAIATKHGVSRETVYRIRSNKEDND